MARRRSPDAGPEPPWRRPPVAIAAVALLLAAAVGVAWLALSRDSGPGGPPTAAIIDQLSLTVDNPDFVQKATAQLEAAGYRVDYFPGERITVDFYRRLPSQGYDFILFRVHADRLEATAKDGTKFDDVVLFTSEPYDREKYVPDQAANRLVIARYREDGEGYFGVAPQFFEQARGGFDGASIVVMGCEGFLTDRTAEAFVQMGAKSYISWDETVSAQHTDLATEVLLQHLLVGKKPPGEAAALTMADVGPDPFYNSRLQAYP